MNFSKGQSLNSTVEYLKNQLPLPCLDHLGARKPASCAVAGSLKQISGFTFS
jgi:hypothetical protein